MTLKICTAAHFAICLILLVIRSTGGEAKNINLLQLSTIENYMNTDHNPCEDFYSYACDKWEETHFMQEYQETIGLLDERTNYNFARILKKIRKTKQGMEHHFVRNILNHYHSCQNVEDYNPRMYLQELKNWEHIQWPTMLHLKKLSRARRIRSAAIAADKNNDWLKMLAVLRRYGLNGIFIEETVIQRRDNATESVIDLDKPVLDGGFRPLLRIEFEVVLDYLDVENKRDVQRLWEWTSNFEYQLQKLTEIEDDEGYQEITLDELNVPQLKIYLETLVDESLPGNINLSVQNLPYFRKMFAAIELYEPEMVRRYIMIRFLVHLLHIGPDNFLRLDCISHLRSMLPLAMTWLYQAHYPMLNKDRENVQLIFNKLKEHYMLTFSSNSYRLNATLIEFLKTKLQEMQLRIGNLPRSTEVITEFYKELILNSSPAAFYQNHLNLLWEYTHAQHARLDGATPLGDNFFHIEDAETGASSSPFYLLRSNMVFVPLGLLQRPIFHRNMHDVYKFSSIGFLLAHEITHGFDESGLEFDRFGNMHGPGETLKTNTHFNHSLNCLRDRQPRYIDEKIADVSGLRLAYDAYFNENSISTYANLEWSSIPSEQLFFLNFAQFFCGRSMRSMDISEHGEDSERVKRTLSNFPEFSRVYHCPLGSAMNPETKCHLWR